MMSSEEFMSLCRELEDVEQSEESDSVKLDLYKERLQRLLEWVPDFTSDHHPAERLSSVSRAVLICVGHSGRHYWTSKDTRQLAGDVLRAVAKVHNQQSCEILLVKEVGLLPSIVNHLKTILTKEQWKYHPVYKHALVWCIKSIEHPDMGVWLPSFLPPILWLCDDYQDYHRTLALSSIAHIIDQMDPTELRWHGRADLLYQAVKPLLYISSWEVIHSLHHCLSKLLPVLNYRTDTAPIPAKPSKTDEVLSILLTSLARESKLTLKEGTYSQAYATQVKRYIILLGIFSVRHMKTLLPLLLTELEHPYPSNLAVVYLDTLSTLICYAWPRVHAHKISILKSLSKLVTTHYPDHHHHHGIDDAPLGDSVVKCMSALLKACPELKEEYEHLEKCCAHQKMKSLLQKTLQEKINTL